LRQHDTRKCTAAPVGQSHRQRIPSASFLLRRLLGNIPRLEGRRGSKGYRNIIDTTRTRNKSSIWVCVHVRLGRLLLKERCCRRTQAVSMPSRRGIYSHKRKIRLAPSRPLFSSPCQSVGFSRKPVYNRSMTRGYL